MFVWYGERFKFGAVGKFEKSCENKRKSIELNNEIEKEKEKKKRRRKRKKSSINGKLGLSEMVSQLKRGKRELCYHVLICLLS